MSRHKTLIVQNNEVSKREWSLTLSSTSAEFRAELIPFLRELAKKHDLVIVNPVADPFGEEAPQKKERKKKGSDGQASLLEG
jgi:hypothetical protein